MTPIIAILGAIALALTESLIRSGIRTTRETRAMALRLAEGSHDPQRTT